MLTIYEKVVQFLLKIYATEEAMAETTKDVENLKQSSSMDVQAYSDELWTRAPRCRAQSFQAPDLDILSKAILAGVR